MVDMEPVVSTDAQPAPAADGRPLRGPLAVGVVIPAGGTARRLGGVSKPALQVGDRSMVARLVADLRAFPLVVVGPRPEDVVTDEVEVTWCTEDPPGGGPAAALAAGLVYLTAVDVVVAIAGDQPFAASAVPRLIEALAANPGADVAWGVDADDRDQPLLAAYRADVLRSRLDEPSGGRSMRQVTAGLRGVRVRLSAVEGIDVDDPADLAAARDQARRARRQ
ncbi:molybdenum cofactor guanylyltransferase [mine drainage metagenome]|uniref:Molybdenum cofactor guanylyltransferase n=1 Tax=mine drainage metagenome TaxID=410659 RepID=A0A1J5RGJ4_9ZZZZ